MGGAAAPRYRELSPFDDGGAPGEAGAEDDEEYEVAALNAAGGDSFIQCDADGGGGGVAVFVDVHKKLLGFGSEALTHGVDDAAVGLVGNDALDLGDGNFAAAQGFFGGG